jgi:hypothetical protein
MEPQHDLTTPELMERVSANLPVVVRAVMGARNIKAVDLAKALDVTPQTLNNKLHSRTEFKANELVGLAEGLGVPISDLVAWAADGSAPIILVPGINGQMELALFLAPAPLVLVP